MTNTCSILQKFYYISNKKNFIASLTTRVTSEAIWIAEIPRFSVFEIWKSKQNFIMHEFQKFFIVQYLFSYTLVMSSGTNQEATFQLQRSKVTFLSLLILFIYALIKKS